MRQLVHVVTCLGTAACISSNPALTPTPSSLPSAGPCGPHNVPDLELLVPDEFRGIRTCRASAGNASDLGDLVDLLGVGAVFGASIVADVPGAELEDLTMAIAQVDGDSLMLVYRIRGASSEAILGAYLKFLSSTDPRVEFQVGDVTVTEVRSRTEPGTVRRVWTRGEHLFEVSELPTREEIVELIDTTRALDP